MFQIEPPGSRLLRGLSQHALASLLNRIFDTALSAGELDFLRDRRLCVVVADSGPSFCVSLRRNRLIVTPSTADWDLRITGHSYDFLLLAARREDADTLFFQRRLVSEGDTELGLHLKNFLDAQDVTTLPYARPMDAALTGLIRLHDRFMPSHHRLRT